MTRFLRNAAVTTQEMVQVAAQRTAGRCAGRHVLAIQDTTPVRVGERRGTGLFLHAMLAVDADDGTVLGLADASFLSHEAVEDALAAKAKNRVRAFADKESARWLDAARAAAKVGATAARVTVVADRESDVFELFAQRPANVDLVVRAKHDRRLGDDLENRRMFARIDAQPERAHAMIELPAKPGRRARQARLAVRWLEIDPVRPGGGGNAKIRPSGVSLRLVDVREIDPPPGAQEIHWRLMTTLPVDTGEQAFAVADIYRRRWLIEQLFRTLKSDGFDIEGVAIAADAPRARLATAALVAAVIVQQLVHARDGVEGIGGLRPLADAFETGDRQLLEAFNAKLEGKTARQKNPHPKGSLAYAAWVCARLGGWTGYYGKPGPIVMLEGWLRFQAAKEGANLAKPDV